MKNFIVATVCIFLVGCASNIYTTEPSNSPDHIVNFEDYADLHEADDDSTYDFYEGSYIQLTSHYYTYEARPDMGKVVISLVLKPERTNSSLEFTCRLDEDDLNEDSDFNHYPLSKGDEVVVVGKVSDKFINTITLSDCEVIQITSAS